MNGKHVIAYVNSVVDHRDTAGLYFYYDLHKGVFDECARLNFELTSFTGPRAASNAARQLPRYAGMLGVIGDERTAEYSRWQEIERRRPCVNIMLQSSLTRGNYVGSDETKAMHMLVRHLYDSGYRRIGCVGFDRAPFARERYRGFIAAIASLELPLRQEWMYGYDALRDCFHPGHFAIRKAEKTTHAETVKRTNRIFEKLMRHIPAPDALVFIKDDFAYDFLSFAEIHALRVPEDIAIAGTNGVRSLENRWETGGLTTVCQDMYEMGRTGVRMLHEIIAGSRHAKGNTILVDTRLRIDRSTHRDKHRGTQDAAFRERVLDYIVRYFADDVPVNTIAGHCGMGARYFRQRFSAVFGASVPAFVNKFRLEKAAFYLRSSGGSVTEICMQVGYHNNQNFNMQFKKMYGCSPTEYRQKHTHPA